MKYRITVVDKLPENYRGIRCKEYDDIINEVLNAREGRVFLVEVTGKSPGAVTFGLQKRINKLKKFTTGTKLSLHIRNKGNIFILKERLGRDI